ncbi:DedA family protein [Micromonospora globbae]|uniref:DedA family protein n=1 Tax=Micromonospora globbae TaxID=1894969 RepID=A0A420F039_9ACTN|nr:DedA family protein [Micromonospora globbae]RKF26298.1 DedA family protein [Micromonospora globbae]
MSAVGFLTSLVARYGYLGLALLVGVESFGVPAPGETAIILGAGYAARGQLAVVGVAVTAFLAAVSGDSIAYLIGRTGGRRVVLRYGRFVGLTRERFTRLEAVMNRHGPKIVAAARFVEGLRQFNGFIAGATGMPWRRFVLYNAAGAAAWVAVWVTVGYLAGNHVQAIVADVHRFQWYVLAAAVVGVLATVAWRLTRRRRRS